MTQALVPVAVRPVVVIISDSQTPYRLNLHTRITLELPEIELWSVFTHEISNAPWQIDSPMEIRPVFFGRGESSDHQKDWLRQPREWRKAGRILAWLQHRRVNAVVLFGYNDLGRLRIIQHCHQNRIPCFLFGDSNVLSERFAGWKLTLKRLVVGAAVRRCAGVFHCGKRGAKYFEQYGARSEAMFPFPYEPDYKAFQVVPIERIADVRKRFKLSSERRYLIYSGRLVPVKRVDLLTRAFTNIARERPCWDLIIAGDGPLRSLLGNSVPPALDGRVVWAGFIGDVTTIAALYKCSEVLILPSDYEPWGVVVTEAATGLALVCSSVVGAAADVLKDKVNGRVFPAGDAEALTEALLDVTNPQNTERMKSASPSVLAEWRLRTDPVVGLRRSLQFVGLLPEMRS